MSEFFTCNISHMENILPSDLYKCIQFYLKFGFNGDWRSISLSLFPKNLRFSMHDLDFFSC
ncbi:hypothetical protein BpHYR1_044176 [Brachionus plicatilis]|uniref:Uncharacterized protein n=1 Tax=Brachionus plicatilis TaxID=10195 RepID=A0A3M7QH76_BRAPC|nr:hypothetical protein BpHYR1_044176 [Brachionus plicatilis]